MDWFLYGNGLRHERANCITSAKRKQSLAATALSILTISKDSVK